VCDADVLYFNQHYYLQPLAQPESYPDAAEGDLFGHAVSRGHREEAGSGSRQTQLVIV
jgi:hypothetical protein